MAKPIGAVKPRRAGTLDEALGTDITHLRVAHGWTQQHLSEKSGYDESYIRQVERGRKSITVRTLSKLAAALSLPASSVLRAAEKRLGKS